LNDVYLHHVTIDQHKKAIQAFLRTGKLICVGKYSSISKLETLSFSKLSPFSPTALECALYRCQFSPPPPRQQHSVLSMPLSRCFANECNAKLVTQQIAENQYSDIKKVSKNTIYLFLFQSS